MSAPIIVVGHKNPDNDSISSAVGYAYLKNELARRAAGEGEPFQTYVPARLGPLPPESAWVLEESGFPPCWPLWPLARFSPSRSSIWP